MAFLSTDSVLTAIRTGLGASVTVDTTTLTWTKKVEGPPLAWLEEKNDYPLIILEPQDTDIAEGTNLLQLSLPVDIHVVLLASSAGNSGVSPAAYKTARLVGEAVVDKLMDAGPRLGTSWLERHPVAAGVNYDLCERYNEHGLLVYSMQFNFRYFEAEP